MLEAPVLGDFQALEQEDHKSLPARVRIAAIRAGVKHVQLVPLDGSAEAVSLVKVMAKKLAPRAATVGTPLNGNGQVVAANRRKVHHSIDVTAFDVSLFSKNGDSAETGLILVTPNVLGRKDLDASAELLALTGWPVAGVVTYRRRSRRSVGEKDRDHVDAVRAYETDHESRFTPLGYL